MVAMSNYRVSASVIAGESEVGIGKLNGFGGCVMLCDSHLCCVYL